MREAERNLSKSTMNQEQIEDLKRDLDRKDERIHQKEMEIERLKHNNLEQERKFNDLLNQEKDVLRDEMMKKLKEKSQDNSLDEYKRQVMALTKQNEDLITKTEGLLSEKDFLQKELTNLERGHNDSVMKIKELNLKYETHIADQEKRLKDAHIENYKKETFIAKITVENEHL